MPSISATPTSLAFVKSIPPVTATPTQVRLWLSTWFPEHLEPHKIDMEYLNFLHSVSWTGRDVHELSETNMKRELEGWGVRYSYACGMARDITRAREIKGKKNCLIMLPLRIIGLIGGFMLAIIQDILRVIFDFFMAMFLRYGLHLPRFN